MATSFETIYNLFVSSVQDYKITSLYSISERDLNHYLEPLLLFSVEKFSPYCAVDLISILDVNNEQFTETIGYTEQIILSHLMVEYWMERVTNNILQMDNKLSDTDFKTYSEAQNLKAKQDYLATVRENNSQLISNYQLNYNISWKNWANGRFYDGI